MLDTDTLSALMRSDTRAVESAQRYLTVHSTFTISLITRFEVLRGLMAKRADARIANFATLCDSLEVLPVTDEIVTRAAAIYGELHRSGKLIGDADILIAATCLEHDLEIATNNVSHFARIPGLAVCNWLIHQD